MSNLNGRLSRLEKTPITKQPEPVIPTDDEIDNLLTVYLARLDTILSNVSPDVLERVDEVLREVSAPPESRVVDHIRLNGIWYFYFYPGMDMRCSGLSYSWPIDATGVTGAHLWILAALLGAGVSALIVAKDAMSGDTVLTADSDNWLNPYAATHARYRIRQVISSIEKEST